MDVPLPTTGSFVNCASPQMRAPGKNAKPTHHGYLCGIILVFSSATLPREWPMRPADMKSLTTGCLLTSTLGGVEHAILRPTALYSRASPLACAISASIPKTCPEPFQAPRLTRAWFSKDGAKMSRSRRGNVVDPGEMIEKYGADTVRLALLPPSLPRRPKGILNGPNRASEGMPRHFLAGVWRLFMEAGQALPVDFPASPQTGTQPARKRARFAAQGTRNSPQGLPRTWGKVSDQHGHSGNRGTGEQVFYLARGLSWTKAKAMTSASFHLPSRQPCWFLPALHSPA